jgi:hypothetical protein
MMEKETMLIKRYIISFIMEGISFSVLLHCTVTKVCNNVLYVSKLLKNRFLTFSLPKIIS